MLKTVKRFITHLFKAQSDPLSINLFKQMLGVVLLANTLHILFKHNSIQDLYTKPFVISYPGLSWITVPSPELFLLGFSLCILASIMLILDKYSKWACLLYAIPFTYFWLIEYSNYNNHYYLISLLLMLLFCISPKHHTAPQYIENWKLYLLRFQIGIAYFYSGFHKLFLPDWWKGLPLHNVILSLNWHSYLGPLATPKIAQLVAISGMLFDISIPFLLLHKKTRKWASILCVAFHLCNQFIFYSKMNLRDSIGIFPLLGICCIILFWDSDQLRNGLKTLKNYLHTQNTPQQKNHPKKNRYPILPTLILIGLCIYPITQYMLKQPILWKKTSLGLYNSFNHNRKMAYTLYQKKKDRYYTLTHSSLNFTVQYNQLSSPENLFYFIQTLQKTAKENNISPQNIRISFDLSINQKTSRILNKNDDLSTLTLKELQEKYPQ